MVTGVMNTEGSITVNFDAVPGAAAYVPHYGPANEADKTKLVFMGYTETTSWTLAAADVPTHKVGDKFHICVQTFNVKGVGANDIEKARDLHDNHLGSEWSDEVVITATDSTP
ncbi:fibronectin type III domain-containing protein [Lactococcus lactis]|uniref:fibronectin type III domain-containing protein n=1 Tax=Lactococcus lactis TaxID=1358 RepID=UPI00112084F2|nr:fibronectin type III domain-containing protein [Lactococcus lactis]MDG4969254.1 fibronectin type III domain-containing protein [Lactococcus lactis]MDG5103348.1 fibronectin type III domain-containing protein [Lactococcus lactis]TNU78250.1 fibronectin type III domain-containing protein [Lactococcus lactis subsp. lactis]